VKQLLQNSIPKTKDTIKVGVKKGKEQQELGKGGHDWGRCPSYQIL